MLRFSAINAFPLSSAAFNVVASWLASKTKLFSFERTLFVTEVVYRRHHKHNQNMCRHQAHQNHQLHFSSSSLIKLQFQRKQKDFIKNHFSRSLASNLQNFDHHYHDHHHVDAFDVHRSLYYFKLFLFPLYPFSRQKYSHKPRNHCQTQPKNLKHFSFSKTLFVSFFESAFQVSAVWNVFTGRSNNVIYL